MDLTAKLTLLWKFILFNKLLFLCTLSVMLYNRRHTRFYLSCSVETWPILHICHSSRCQTTTSSTSTIPTWNHDRFTFSSQLPSRCIFRFSSFSRETGILRSQEGVSDSRVRVLVILFRLPSSISRRSHARLTIWLALLLEIEAPPPRPEAEGRMREKELGRERKCEWNRERERKKERCPPPQCGRTRLLAKLWAWWGRSFPYCIRTRLYPTLNGASVDVDQMHPTSASTSPKLSEFT